MCCRLAVCTQMMATQAKCSTPPEAQSAIPACRAWQPPQAPPPCGGKATVCSRPHPSAAAADVQPGLQTPGQAVFALDEGPSRKPGANQPQNRAGWSLPLPAVPQSPAVPDGMCARQALFKSLPLLMQGATDVILGRMVMVLLGEGVVVECFQRERLCRLHSNSSMRLTLVRSVCAQKSLASKGAAPSWSMASEMLHASTFRCHCSSHALACFLTLSSCTWYRVCRACSRYSLEAILGTCQPLASTPSDAMASFLGATLPGKLGPAVPPCVSAVTVSAPVLFSQHRLPAQFPPGTRHECRDASDRL